MNQYAFLEVFSEGATIQDALHESSKVNCCNKSDKQIDFRYVIKKRTMTELTYNTEVQIVTLTLQTKPVSMLHALTNKIAAVGRKKDCLTIAASKYI